MSKDIRFTGERTRHFDMGGISFRAIVDGQTCACIITDEALQDHFGAKHGSPESAFDLNRRRIEEIARGMIEGHRVSADGRVVIKSADINDGG